MVQSPTGSGKSAVFMCLPFLADAVLSASLLASAANHGATRHPLVFLYCFPLESIRREVILSLRRVVDELNGAVLATSPEGKLTADLPDDGHSLSLPLTQRLPVSSASSIRQRALGTCWWYRRWSTCRLSSRCLGQPCSMYKHRAYGLSYLGDVNSLGDARCVRGYGRGSSMVELVCYFSPENGPGALGLKGMAVWMWVAKAICLIRRFVGFARRHGP